MPLCLYFADANVFPPSDKSIKALRRLGGNRMSEIDSVLVLNPEDITNYDYIAATLSYIKTQSVVLVQEVSDIRVTNIDSPLCLFYASICKEYIGNIHTRVVNGRGTDLTIRSVSTIISWTDQMFNLHMTFKGTTYAMLFKPNADILHDIYSVPVIPAAVFTAGKAIVSGDNSNMVRLAKLYEQMLVQHFDVMRKVNSNIRPIPFNTITMESGYVTHLSID